MHLPLPRALALAWLASTLVACVDTSRPAALSVEPGGAGGRDAAPDIDSGLDAAGGEPDAPADGGDADDADAPPEPDASAAPDAPSSPDTAPDLAAAPDLSPDLWPDLPPDRAPDMYVPPPGLIAAYSFNQGSGNTLTDITGHGYNGTIVGATWTAGKYGMALSFDGVDDRVDLGPAAPLYGDGSRDITIEAWIWMRQEVATQYWHHRDIIRAYAYTGGTACSGSQSGLNVRHTSPTTRDPRFSLSHSNADGCGATTDTLTMNIALGVWYHLAGTYDASTKTLRSYLDGALMNTATWTSAGPITWFNNVRIGGSDNLSAFPGLIDEIRIYDRVLSQMELQIDMNTPL